MTEHLNDEQLNTLADRMRMGASLERDADSLREHLESCSQCRERFGRLVKMLSVSEAMPRRVEPPADLWPGIRASIEGRSAKERDATTDVASASANQPWYARRRARISLAAAAGVIIAIALGSYARGGFRIDTRNPGNATATAPTSPSGVAPVSTVTPDTEDLRAEEELLAALALRRSALRPSTSAQIDSSLKVIDAAIAELEAARARDPGNAAIRQLLASSRARKLELLKQAQNAS
jgi:hypothetical protein